MRVQRSVGLVVEGNATSSAVLKLPSITHELGPIKAGALRVARRLSNFLRAGYAVDTYAELRDAGMVLIRVPDTAIPRVVNELCMSDLDLAGMAFVLCESCLSTDMLKPLQTRGAATATVSAVQTPRKSWFVLEGQMGAVRPVKRLLERGEARALELRPGTKRLYFAAQMLVTALPLPLFVTAQQALRAAGISGNHLYELMEEMSLEMFRSFANGARVNLLTARTGCSAGASAEYMEQLRFDYPQIAAVLDEQLTLATRLKEYKIEA